MTTKKISELTAASALTTASYVPAVTSGVTERATLAQVKTVIVPNGYVLALPPSVLKSGYWSAPGNNMTSNNGYTTNVLSAVPVRFSHALTLDRLALLVTVNQASTNGRVGLYADTGSFYPGSLLVDGGSVDTSAAAALNSVTISQAVSVDTIYWLAAVIQGAGTKPTIGTMNVPGAQVPIPNASVALITASNYVAYTDTGITGALPGTWTSTVTVQITANLCPRVYFRAA